MQQSLSGSILLDLAKTASAIYRYSPPNILARVLSMYLVGQAQYCNDDGERAERSLRRFLQAICEIGGTDIDTKSFERRITKYLAKLVFKQRDFEDCGLFCRKHLGTFDHSYYKHEYIEAIVFVQTLKWEMGLDDDAVGISSSHKIAMLDTELIRPSV
jgi:hypothetical protein